jgi:hypothetical protein
MDYRDQPLKIDSISTSSRSLQVRLSQTPDRFLPGWRFNFIATLRDGAYPPGNYAESILLHTSDPERPIIQVKALIHRIERIRVAPDPLYLREDPTQPGRQSARFFLDDLAGDSLEIADIRCSDPNLKCTARPPGESQKIFEVVLNEKGVKNQAARLKLRIALRKPVSEELCVTVIPAASSRLPALSR